MCRRHNLTWNRPMRQHHCATSLMLWLFFISSSYLASSINAQLEIDLVPFQILYITNTSVNASAPFDAAMDDMTVLSVTRSHLERVAFSDLHTGFRSLTLYQTVRTDAMFTNGTKIAFAGSALYNNSNFIQEDPTTDCAVFASFLGPNQTAYIQALRAKGWTSLEGMLLMTINGSMVYMNANGTDIVMEDPSEEESNSAATMDEDMSKMIYFVSVFVPLSLIFLLGTCFVCYMLRYNIQWKQRRPADVHPVWINIHNPTKRGRRRTGDGDGSDELTLDVASVAPPLDASHGPNAARSTMRITGFPPAFSSSRNDDLSNLPRAPSADCVEL